jgi:hypothetical protein
MNMTPASEFYGPGPLIFFKICYNNICPAGTPIATTLSVSASVLFPVVKRGYAHPPMRKKSEKNRYNLAKSFLTLPNEV